MNDIYTIVMYFLIFAIVGVRGCPPNESSISIHGLEGVTNNHMTHRLYCDSPKGFVYHITVIMVVSLKYKFYMNAIMILQ